MRAALFRLGAVTVVVVAAGCGVFGGTVSAPNDRLAPFPECQTDEYAFVGETSLGALGLGEMSGGPDAGRIGMVWITAGPVEQPAPGPVGVPGQDFPAQRMVCVEWQDGSGMAGPIDDAWTPPSTTVVADDEAVSPPVGQLALLVAALVVIGVSVIAFRREG